MQTEIKAKIGEIRNIANKLKEGIYEKDGLQGKYREITNEGDRREYWETRENWGNEDEDLKIFVRRMVLNAPV